MRSGTACGSRRSPPGSSSSTASPTGRSPSARPCGSCMLPDTTALPSNDEIEAALDRAPRAVRRRRARRRACARQREQALAWMRRLAAWEPLLVGGVAAGWATEHSDVRLELVADDPKAVEIELAGHGVAYAALPSARRADARHRAASLRIESPRAHDPPRRSSRRRSGATGRGRDDEPRLTAEAAVGADREEPDCAERTA